MFYLKDKVAVLVKYSNGETREMIVPMNQYRVLQASKDIVILEAWTMGTRISN